MVPQFHLIIKWVQLENTYIKASLRLNVVLCTIPSSWCHERWYELRGIWAKTGWILVGKKSLQLCSRLPLHSTGKGWVTKVRGTFDTRAALRTLTLTTVLCLADWSPVCHQISAASYSYFSIHRATPATSWEPLPPVTWPCFLKLQRLRVQSLRFRWDI